MSVSYHIITLCLLILVSTRKQWYRSHIIKPYFLRDYDTLGCMFPAQTACYLCHVLLSQLVFSAASCCPCLGSIFSGPVQGLLLATTLTARLKAILTVLPDATG